MIGLVSLAAELSLALAVLWLVGVTWNLRRLVNSLEERQHYLMRKAGGE